MKRRSDCFWGLHFDFHAQPKDGVQGLNLSEESIREICRLLKPDFIQIDCKGHPGWASYPSELGNALPEFASDPLSLWRRVTKEEDVLLYMHYSGIYDRKYCAEHPEQGVLMGDGTLHTEATKLNCAYVDELLIPQLSELAEKYGVNGVWVDGDCWMALADFTEKTVSDFERETGINLGGKLPIAPSDDYYQQYREYNRELYRRYLRHYVDGLHEKHPNFEICSNWAFSDHMPEKVSANVDFLSGDLNPINSFNSARYAARALAQQKGYAWDLMSWNFRNSAGGRAAYVAKHVNQLKQEASAVIAVGGAFQDYIPQNRDGTPKMWELRNLKELSDFVLARKDFCHRGVQIHQAALLLSTYDRGIEATHLYSRTGYEKVMGMTALLCDIGQSLEIVCEHTLESNINEYKMIVVPELYFGLEDKTVKSLLKYAQMGGNLVLVGKNTCSFFASHGAPFSCNEREEYIDLPVNATQNGHNNKTTAKYKPYHFTMDSCIFGALFSPCEIVAENGKSNATFGPVPQDVNSLLSATVPYGDGTVSALGFDIGSQYLSCSQFLHRELMKSITNGLYKPLVRIKSALGRLEVVALLKDGRTMVQLVNAGGTHADSCSSSDDYIPPVLDICLEVSLSKKPKKLVLQPEGKELDFTYCDGKAQISISRIDIHSIVEIFE